ncbi:MAG: DUF433 domain-containing protein [Anaerolineae bacterium]|nr:DUF433 domain-containing protein [Anaerolineae bacterium]
MSNAQVNDLAAKLDSIQEAITRLEARVNEISTREPGQIRTDHPYIVRVQGVCGGRPVIEGTRLSVKLIAGWARMGLTPEEIAGQYPEVSIEQVSDALAYRDHHPEEIEAEFVQERRYAETEIPRLQAMIAERRAQNE